MAKAVSGLVAVIAGVFVNEFMFRKDGICRKSERKVSPVDSRVMQDLIGMID